MSINRVNISSHSPWEDIVGYSRAVRINNQIFISGTTATDNHGEIVGVGDPYLQTKQCIKNIEDALIKAGAALKDVTRLKIFTTDIDDWENIGRALSESFGKIKPAMTMIEVSRLIASEIIVEIEADAFVE